MENKTNLELYLLNCEKIRDFCFFKKMNIEETDEFKKINELIPSVIKEKYLYSYSKNNNLSFSTREAAEEYILMNKPLLSLSDVWDNLKVKDQKEVMKFVKSKLNK